MRNAICALLVLAAGCGGGRGSLLLSISASPPIAGVDEVAIVITDEAGRRSRPAVHPIMPAWELGESPYRLNLQLPPGLRGTAVVTVTARRMGAALGMGSGEGTVTDGVQNEVHVRIGGAGSVDLGGMDTAAPVDMAAPVDLDVRSDLAVVQDMACPPAPGDREWVQWVMPNPRGSGLPNLASYDTSTPGIVKDLVTKLEWQRGVDAKLYSWADAMAYCAGLQLSGGCWRLPSRVELMSLVDFTQRDPSIDPGAFPNTPVGHYWTSSPVAGDPSQAWFVFFSLGDSWIKLATTPHRVRCVR